MLDWLDFVASMFGKFVQMLFRLPFYGDVSYGFMLVAVYVIALLLVFLVGRLK